MPGPRSSDVARIGPSSTKHAPVDNTMRLEGDFDQFYCAKPLRDRSGLHSLILTVTLIYPGRNTGRKS